VPSQVSSSARIAGRLTALAEAVPDDEAQAAASHACAEVALLDGDVDAALASFGLAEEHAEAAGLPFPLAVVRSRAGAVLADAGRRAEAVRALRAARRVTASLGATPTTSRVDALLAALGEPAHGAAGVVGGLTGREAEVLAKVAAGLTSRQIAADLVLSIRTVDMHVANAMTKLDCRTRAQAASAYLGWCVPRSGLRGVDHTSPTRTPAVPWAFRA
jgi:DNA-binding CsgD family transcriptional regulator